MPERINGDDLSRLEQGLSELIRVNHREHEIEELLDLTVRIRRMWSQHINCPRVVCLCGSTRFWRTFQQASLQETMAGRIVLSIGAASGTDDEHFGNLPQAKYDAIKTMLDQLHFRKIELADEILVLNIGGYIGESTRNEINHAEALGRPIRYWEEIS